MNQIKSAVVTFNDPRIGSYTFVNRSIGGNVAIVGGEPFPSEGQAWIFGKGIVLLEHFMSMPYQEQMELLDQLKL